MNGDDDRALWEVRYFAGKLLKRSSRRPEVHCAWNHGKLASRHDTAIGS